MNSSPGLLKQRHVVRLAAVVCALLLNVAAVWFVIDRTLSDSPPRATAPVEETGPSTSEPPAGLVLTVAPSASGMLNVVEQVRTGRPVLQLLLRPPPTVLEDGTQPRIIDLVVEADGRPVPGFSPRTFTGASLVVLPTAAREVVLRYRLEGVTEMSRPGSDPRALLTLRPLASVAVADSSTVVEIVGAVVHNLVCPALPLEDQLCGRLQDGVWSTAPVPSAQSIIVAQVDLPDAEDSGA